MLLLLLLPLALIAFSGAVAFSYVFSSVPLPSDIGTSATVIKDSQGNELGTLQPQVGQTEVPLGEVPDHVIQAVLAAEDASFYEHRGISFPGLLRAAFINVVRGGVHQGGSTISQQYVKTVTADAEQTMARKVREAALAVKLEREFSKDEILSFYLNTIYFGRGAYGIEAAAQAFFGKPAAELDPAEAALLAAVIPAPSRLDPRDNPDGAERRYHYVIDRLRDEGWLDPGEAGRLRETMPETIERRRLSWDVAPYFLDAVRDELAAIVGEEQIYRGYTVTTTLNLGVQRAAERAFADHLGDAPASVTGSIVAIDPSTGGIRALIGGRDRSTDEFNVALSGRRQVGSTFKAFTLAAWVEQGNSPETYFDGPAEVTLETGAEPWVVRNYGGQDFGAMSVREATWASVNTVFAQMSVEVTPEAQVEVAERAGIPGDRLAPDPSITLGVHELTPLELAGAFNTFNTGGIAHPPRSVLRVERDGAVAYEASIASERAFSEQVASHVTDVLRGVMTNGTGRNAAIGRPAAGKTGTTQNNADAWFAGYTPHLTAVVWMGHRDGNTPMEGNPTGGGVPALAWADFMATALQNVEPVDFPPPTGDLRVLRPSPTPTEPAVPDCPEGEEPAPDPDDPDTLVCVAVEPTPTPSPTPTPTPAAEEPTAEPTPAPSPSPAPAPPPSPSPTGGSTPAPTDPPDDDADDGDMEAAGASPTPTTAP